MEVSARELLVARIVTGTTRLRVMDENDKAVTVLVKPSRREDKYIAQEVYQDVEEDARLTGCYSEEELLQFLYEQKLWSDDQQKLMRSTEKDIEDFKVKLVELIFRTVEKKTVKSYLSQAKKKYQDLANLRHGYDHLTCAGVAGMARTRHLVGASLYFIDGSPVLPEGVIVFENVLEAFLESRLRDDQLRELARTDPWRSIWSARAGASSLFGVAAVDMTDEQVRLQVWSQMYENVASHPECPSEDIIDDDDMLDGWLIIQKRKRDQQAFEAKADSTIGNEAIRNSEEIYIIADNRDDAERIESLNDGSARHIKKQREAQMAKKGQIEHAEFADMRQQKQMLNTQLRAAKVNNG